MAVAMGVCVLVLALPAAAAAAAAPTGPARQGPPAQPHAAPVKVHIYVPIKQPKMSEAPPAAAAPLPAAKPTHAQQMAETTAHAVVSVPMMKVGGTPIPLWWMLLGLLSIPLAKLWQRWTARMFV